VAPVLRNPFAISFPTPEELPVITTTLLFQYVMRILTCSSYRVIGRQTWKSAEESGLLPQSSNNVLWSIVSSVVWEARSLYAHARADSRKFAKSGLQRFKTTDFPANIGSLIHTTNFETQVLLWEVVSRIKSAFD